jgi:hypothetical protein
MLLGLAGACTISRRVKMVLKPQISSFLANYANGAVSRHIAICKSEIRSKRKSRNQTAVTNNGG